MFEESAVDDDLLNEGEPRHYATTVSMGRALQHVEDLSCERNRIGADRRTIIFDTIKSERHGLVDWRNRGKPLFPA